MTRKTSEYKNQNGRTVTAEIDFDPIQCYFIVIDFDGNKNLDKNRDEIYFHDEEQYGWKGKTVMNFQKAEEELKEQIQGEDGNGKAKYVVICTHGGFLVSLDGIIAKNDLAMASDNNNNHYLSTERLNIYINKEQVVNKYEDDLEAQIKPLREKLEQIELRKSARKVREAIYYKRELSFALQSFLETNTKDCKTIIKYSDGNIVGADGEEYPDENEITYSISITDNDIAMLKKGKTIKIKDFTSELYEYDFYGESQEDNIKYIKNNKKINLEAYKGKKLEQIELELTEQVKKDIESLKNILYYIEDGGYLCISSCHAAWVHTNKCYTIDKIEDFDRDNHDYACYSEKHADLVKQGWKEGLLEQVFLLGNKRVNIIGLTGLGTIVLKMDKSNDKIGHYYAKERIGNTTLNSLVKDITECDVVLIPTSYDLNNENRSPEIYKDITVVPYKLDLIR